jgi:putative addiction module component (TIGR02574 family)
MALPEEECSNLVNRDLEEMTEEEFAAELKRRWDEYQRDPSVGIPWSEVKRQG